LIANINEILGTDLTPIHTDPRPGDVRHSLADITAAQEVLGYRAKVDLGAGLRQAVAWYREFVAR
jgi:nucleoside-diphosphate-sugar epimerase